MNDKQKEARRAIMTSSFRDRESAERAYNGIVSRCYKADDIDVLTTDETRKKRFR